MKYGQTLVNRYVFCHSSLPAAVVIDAESEDDATRILSLISDDENWIAALAAEIDENDGRMHSIDLRDNKFPTIEQKDMD